MCDSLRHAIAACFFVGDRGTSPAMRTAFAALLLAAACGSGKQPPAQPKAPEPAPIAHGAPATPAVEEGPATPAKPVTNKSLAAIGLDPDALDRDADPCED